VDSGVIYRQEVVSLAGKDLLGDLRAEVAESTASLCKWFVDEFPRSAEAARVQEGAPSYYPRRSAKDSRLNPKRTLADQCNMLRVVDNERYPAFMEWHGVTVELYVRKGTRPSNEDR
jgi:methionyl-tRNA formyltransferase